MTCFWRNGAVAAALIVLHMSGPARAADPHDGLWSVSFVAQQGDCQQRGIEVRVSSGTLTHTGAGIVFTASGHVDAGGSIQASLSALGHLATAQGRLDTQTGSRTWSLREFGCSGQWTARRIGN